MERTIIPAETKDAELTPQQIRARTWQRRRKLLRWGLETALFTAVISWLFPKYPVLYWSLLVLIPLGIWGVISIFRAPAPDATQAE